jgi:hypothetical protein
MVKPFYHFFFQLCGLQNSSGSHLLNKWSPNYFSSLYPSHVVDNAFFITSSTYVMVAEDCSVVSWVNLFWSLGFQKSLSPLFVNHIVSFCWIAPLSSVSSSHAITSHSPLTARSV